MIRFHCPCCANTLQVDDSLAGKTGECPSCRQSCAVPSSAAMLSPPPKNATNLPSRQDTRWDSLVEDEVKKARSNAMPPGGTATVVAQAILPPSLICPRCNCTETQSVPVVYAGGRSTGDTVAIAIGPGIGPIVGGASSVHRTDLAQRLAPPVRRRDNPYKGSGRIGWLVSLSFMGVALVPFLTYCWLADSPSILFFGLLTAFLPPFLAWLVLLNPSTDWEERETRRHTSAHDTWSRQFFCHRCGHVFIP